MNLKDICNEILDIATKMRYGQVSFTYDKLACAMKMGHPSEFLMEALSDVFLKVRDNIRPTKEEVESLLRALKRNKRNFKIAELSKPIKELTAYIAQMN